MAPPAGYIPAQVPVAGEVVTITLSFITISMLAVCLTRRVQAVQSWKELPLTHWLIVLIYGDSYLFVLFTGVISHGLGVNTSASICEGAILLCLVCYVSTKVMIYFFLVEKAHIIRASRKPRMQDRQYLINVFGMICPYLVVVVLNFVFRFSYIDSAGQCIIGMKKIAMIPLICFDVLVNVYLNFLFLIPLRKLYSYKHNANRALRTMALRTFIGSCATLISSVVNLTMLMALGGEPGWICLMCCNADILFSVLVLHWITSTDRLHDASQPRSGPIGTAPPGSRSSTGRGVKLEAWNKDAPHRKTRAVTPTVTTHISATPTLNPKHYGPMQDAEFGINEIQVRTEQRQQVEADAKSDSSERAAMGEIEPWHGEGVSMENIVGPENRLRSRVY